MLRVLLTHNPEDLEAYYGRALDELEPLAEVVRNTVGRDFTTGELIEAAGDCDVIVSHRATPGPSALFESTPRLLAFLHCAVDIRNVDVDAANRAGVLVATADKSFVPSTAELAIALMLDLARSVTASTIDYRSGGEPAQRPGRQLRGATAGIIGFGAIGSYLAGLLVSIGMRVLVHDPYVEASGPGVEPVSLDALLAGADFILPLAAATAQTERLIGPAELARMRPGTFLVNVSRGDLLDEAAVAASLDSGHLGGLAMDVGMAPDQRPSPHLAAREGVVATPHLGGLTPENADAQARSSVEQIRAILTGEMPPRAVNAEAATRLREYWATREGRAD